MGLFDGKQDPTSARFDALMEELADLKTSVAEIKGERAATRTLRDMERQYAETKKQLTDLQIEFDREKEKHEREKREVEHLVGLERKRSTFEREQGVAEAKVAVREENLAHERERFEDQMKFITTRFEKEVEQSKELMMDILARLPKIETLVKLTQEGANGNGAKEEVTA
jgi:predicted  nucleic acid-binding Zn-ribbon protein